MEYFKITEILNCHWLQWVSQYLLGYFTTVYQLLSFYTDGWGMVWQSSRTKRKCMWPILKVQFQYWPQSAAERPSEAEAI